MVAMVIKGTANYWGGFGDNNFTFKGATGKTRLEYGDGNVKVMAGVGRTQILGGDGNSLIYGNRGWLTAELGNGNNRIIVEMASTVEVSVGNGNNLIDLRYGGYGDILAGHGNNTLLFGDGVLFANLGNGNNRFQISGGDIDIRAGNGNNIANIFGGGSVRLTFGDGDNKVTASNGQAGGAQVDATFGSGHNTITTARGDDFVYAQGGTLKATTGAGEDYVYAEGKDDLNPNIIKLGADDDYGVSYGKMSFLSGDGGDDNLTGAGRVLGGADNDRVFGMPGASLTGGTGGDTFGVATWGDELDGSMVTVTDLLFSEGDKLDLSSFGYLNEGKFGTSNLTVAGDDLQISWMDEDDVRNSMTMRGVGFDITQAGGIDKAVAAGRIVLEDPYGGKG
jgi:hypothetical protein